MYTSTYTLDVKVYVFVISIIDILKYHILLHILSFFFTKFVWLYFCAFVYLCAIHNDAVVSFVVFDIDKLLIEKVNMGLNFVMFLNWIHPRYVFYSVLMATVESKGVKQNSTLLFLLTYSHTHSHSSSWFFLSYICLRVKYLLLNGAWYSSLVTLYDKYKYGKVAKKNIEFCQI